MPTGYVIDMIDVGQGDAFVVATRTTDGIRNCLIDAGRKSDGGIVVDHLRRHYDGKLTYALLTHIDEDHIGGFGDVLDANDPRDALERFVRTGSVLLSEQTVQINASIATSDGIIQEIDRLDIERHSAFAAQKITLSGALEITILSPYADAFPELVSKFTKGNREKLAERAPDERRVCTAENDASVVCVAAYKSEDLYDRALFTGDACVKTLKRVASERFDYVKAPHHGSWHCCDDALVKTCTGGRENVRGAFSFGKNRYGHPDRDVVEWFRSSSARILCTHCHGTVQSRRAGADNIGKWGGRLENCACG